MTRIALFVICTVAAAQVTANGQLQFDVASVKLIAASPGFHQTALGISHGRFNANFAALRQIAGVAYNVQRVRVVRGPDWMDSEKYMRSRPRPKNPNASVDVG